MLADILHYQALNVLAPLPLPAALSHLFDIPFFRQCPIAPVVPLHPPERASSSK